MAKRRQGPGTTAFPGLWLSLTALALMVTACADEPAYVAPPGFTDDAIRVLDGARRALGGTTVDRITDIATTADVTSAAGAFETTIYADRDGRARMKQSSGFDVIVDRDAAWAVDAEGHRVVADAETHALVRGHELHMLALDPRAMFETARLAAATTFAGIPCMAVEFADPAGREVVVYYAQADTTPVGARAVWAEPDVVITFGQWEVMDDVRVFREARFQQGQDAFDYLFNDIRFNTLSPESLALR